MPKANRECLYCKTPYYVCRACISINSWKNVCDTPECYKNLMKELEAQKTPAPVQIEKGEVKDVKGLLKKTATNTKATKVEVEGYDLIGGKFDCSDGKTHTADEFDHFEVTYDELKDIAKGEI